MPGCATINWQAMFRDPSILDPEIRAHLEAENAYQKAAMADTEALQKALFAEMKGRIKEDDSSVPMKDGPYAYGNSFVTGGAQQRSTFREAREGGDRQVLLRRRQGGGRQGLFPPLRPRPLHPTIPARPLGL